MDVIIADLNKKAHDIYRFYDKKRSRTLTLVLYTIIFCVVFLLGFNVFIRDRVSLINIHDGVSQHYVSLLYLGRYYREIASNFLHGNFTIPMFDFNLGMGSDIVQTFHYYGLGDPLVLISAFVPESGTDILYNVLAVLRFYLSGLAFLYMCKYFGKRDEVSLVGAIVYAFCGFSLTSIKHPYFLNPTIYLPLLIVGVDKILNRKRPHLFILMVFVSAISNFYFFYMITICVFIYAAVRIWDIVEQNKFKSLCAAFFRCAFYYIIGIMLAMFIFLPAIMGFFNSGRVNSVVNQNLFCYPIREYVNILLKFVMPTESWRDLGLAAISLISVIILFTKKDKKFRTLKVLFIICSIFLIIPFFSYMMNGFGYVSARWTFGFALVVSYIVVEMLPHLFNITQKQNFTLVLAILFYSVCSIISRSYRNFYSVAVLSFLYACILLCQKKSESSIFSRGTAACLLFVCINVIFNVHVLYSTSFGGYEKSFARQAAVYNSISNTPVSSLLPLKDKEFCRVSKFTDDMRDANKPMLLRYPGVSTYYSLVNSSLCNLRLDQEIIDGGMLFKIYGCEFRTVLETLCSVKYFCKDEDSDVIPFGFEKLYDKVRYNNDSSLYLSRKTPTKRLDTVYKNKYALPLGYTYSATISEDKFMKFNPLQKQESMIRAVALSGASDAPIESSFESQKLDVRVENSEGAYFKNSRLKIDKANSSIFLRYNGVANSETYVRFKNVTSGKYELKATIICGDIIRNIYPLSEKSIWYAGQNSYLINLGYNKLPTSDIEIKFQNASTFNIDDIEVYCLPMTQYEKYIQKLREEPLKNIVVSTNQINGNVDLSSDKVLCVSIPYSSSWKATVDGKNAEILKANNLFMALKLSKGHHDIQLNYSTPMLGVGLVVTIVTLLGLVAYYIFSFITRNNQGYYKKKN